MDSGYELGEKSKTCRYHNERNDNSLVYQECYKEIQCKNISYTSGEFIVIQGPRNKEIGQIICFFIKSLKFQAVIVKYVFARYYKTLFKSKGYAFDENNEVLQDTKPYYIIDITNSMTKCNIAILTLDDDPYYVSKVGLNASSNFSLRFKIKSNELYPLLTESGDASKLYIKSVIKGEQTSIPKLEVSNVDEIGTRAISPRRKVKRNLNSSFADIENYISSDDDSDDGNSLTMNLRKSRSFKKPEKRKSARNVLRKSYADYESPKKTSEAPEEENCLEPSKESPTKKLLTEMSNMKLESLTKNIDTPRRSQRIKRSFYFQEDSESDNPAISPNKLVRRIPGHNTREVNYEDGENDSGYTLKSLTKKVNTTPKKRMTPITSRHSRKHKEGLTDEDIEPSAGTEHDDSLRTRMLKIRLEPLYVDEDNVGQDSKPSTNYKISSTKILTDLTSSSEKSESFDETELPPQQFFVSSLSDKSTPSSRLKRNQKTVQSPKTPKTTRRARKLIREGEIAPSIQSMDIDMFSRPVSTPYLRVRTELHVSHVPKSLPCREQEYADIYGFLKRKLLDGVEGCMYISGVPGTGKTATVTSVVTNLQTEKSVPEFTFVNINAMTLSEPRQAYVEIFKQLGGKVVRWEQAQTSLENIFLKSKSKKPIVIVVDELDILCTRRQDVVYNLLDWPSKAKTQLIVITIANTMDLPERLLMNRVASRLGLTRLTFKPYSHQHLQQIITERLTGIVGFNKDAVQYVARKVASVSGDARRALDICRRAVEIAEQGKGIPKVDMKHVSAALDSMITQPKVKAIKFCPKLEQLILKSIVAEMERTGIEETTFLDVYKMLATVCGLEGCKMFSQTGALAAVSKLGSSRLIITDQKCNNVHQKIVLNVSVDDIYFALQKRIDVKDIVLEPLAQVPLKL